MFMDTIFEKRDGIAIIFHIKYKKDENKWHENYAKRKKNIKERREKRVRKR